jgi:hypothetical protein
MRRKRRIKKFRSGFGEQSPGGGLKPAVHEDLIQLLPRALTSADSSLSDHRNDLGEYRSGLAFQKIVGV